MLTTTTAGLAASDDAIGRENAALRRLVVAFQHLSSLAVQETDLQSATELIAERVDAAVSVVDENLVVLACSGGMDSEAAQFFTSHVGDPRLAQVLEVVGPMRRALRIPGAAPVPPIIVAPIPLGETVAAYLLTLDDSGGLDEGDDWRLLLSEHAATICGVILGRDRVVAAAATQARDDLIEGLLSGRGSDADEVRRWAAHVGYDETRPHRVIVIDADTTHDSGEAETVSAFAQRFFTAQFPDAITAIRGCELVVVLPESDPTTRPAVRLAEQCIGRVVESFPDAKINAGIGGALQSATGIAASYDDARRTVEILARTGRAGITVAMEDLGIHRLLLQTANVAQLRSFVREVFGSLLDQANGTAMEYLSTLACYFRENNSPQRAAHALHLHRNTVTYRIRRVEEFTRLDFHNYRDRLIAQVALEIMDMVHIEGDNP